MNSYYNEGHENKIEKLVKNNLDLVKKIAWQIFGKVNNVVEIEDLIQQGMEGLIQAAQKYTSKEGVDFTQYAYLRIRGSIIDYLRKNSNLCRTTIKKKQEFDSAYNFLLNKLSKEPTKAELIKHLGITNEEFSYWENAFQANKVQSLDEIYDEFSILFASNNTNPEEQFSDLEMKNLLKNALKNLNQREIIVTQLYYVEELNVYEIAEILDLTNGRISQIKSNAIKKLRTELKKTF